MNCQFFKVSETTQTAGSLVLKRKPESIVTHKIKYPSTTTGFKLVNQLTWNTNSRRSKQHLKTVSPSVPLSVEHGNDSMSWLN
jgi:hypothetical protein